MEITNEQGKQIVVSEDAIEQLMAAHEANVFAVIGKDIHGVSNTVIIQENF